MQWDETDQQHGVYYLVLKPLGKATKDNHKIQLHISENTQSSAILDPRVSRDVGQVPKTVLSIQALIIVQFHLKLLFSFFSCATLTHIIYVIISYLIP